MSGGVFTRTAGTVITTSDVNGGSLGAGIGFQGTGFVLRITAVTGNVFTLDHPEYLSNGSYTWELYQAVMIDSIAGNDVTYHGVGPHALTQAPTAANSAAGWAIGDGSNAADWTITHNTFYAPSEFILYLKSISYPTFPGKGRWEMKHMKRMLVEGNRFLGYPTALFMRLYNQDGSEPWSTVEDITIKNNYFQATDTTDTGGQAFGIYLNDPYDSAQPGKNVYISNNLVLSFEGVLNQEGGTVVECCHNTVINTAATPDVYHAIATNGYAMGSPSGFVYRDNISSYRNYGFVCFIGGGSLAECWPAGTWSKNVVVDTEAAGFSSTVWGAGSILTPIPTSFSSVGFTNQSTGNYRLTAGSAYKGLGTSGTDPGIDQDALEAALGGAPPAAGVTVSNVRLFIQVI
jgi:hypothetical protein